jgi:hypothetical protein
MFRKLVDRQTPFSYLRVAEVMVNDEDVILEKMILDSWLRPTLAGAGLLTARKP